MEHAPLFLLLFGENPGNARSFPGKQTLVTKTNLTIAIDYFADSPWTGRNWLKTAKSGANDGAT